jgi:hypothetical protein
MPVRSSVVLDGSMRVARIIAAGRSGRTATRPPRAGLYLPDFAVPVPLGTGVRGKTTFRHAETLPAASAVLTQTKLWRVRTDAFAR